MPPIRKYSEKVDKLIEGYNTDQEKALALLNDNSNQFTPDYLKKQTIQKLQENFKIYNSKAQALLGEFVQSLDTLNLSKAKKLYPALSSDNNKVAGEMQFNHAKNLLSNIDNNRPEVLKELEQSLQLNRIDFISTLFDNLTIPDKNAVLDKNELDFWNKVSELKDKFYNAQKVNDLIESITDLKNSAIPKTNLFTTEIKKGTTYISLPDPNSNDFNDQYQLATMEGDGYAEGIGGEAAATISNSSGE